MSIELIVASVAITCALVLYTFGVFGERRSGTLSLRHVLLFWGGLVCDTTGTMIMSNIAQQSSAGGFGIHAVTGLLGVRAVPRREGSCAYRRALGVGFQSRERHARSLSNPGSRSGDPGFACLRMLAFAGQDGR